MCIEGLDFSVFSSFLFIELDGVDTVAALNVYSFIRNHMIKAIVFICEKSDMCIATVHSLLSLRSRSTCFSVIDNISLF